MSTSTDSTKEARTFIVCGVVVERDGKYLLVQEKQPHVYGKWNLPGGKVDEGETLEKAAAREALEECGLNVKLGRHLQVLHQATDRPVMHSYLAESFEGDVVYPESEILATEWFSYDEIVKMKDQLRNQEYVIGSIEAARS